MKKLTLSDFRGNKDRYRFYLQSYKIFEEMEEQRQIEGTYNLEEDTSLYKDSVKNQVTSKSKSSKSNVEHLIKK